MIKNLLFLGALAPSMLCGNSLPSRSLDSQPTLQVGDVYNITFSCNINDHDVNKSIKVFSPDYDDNGSYNLISIDTSKISYSNFSSEITRVDLNSSYGTFNFDYFILTLKFAIPGSLTYTCNPFECDNAGDDFTYAPTIKFDLSQYSDDFSFDVSIEFTILSNHQNIFSNEILPYLTKVETPYTPPAKSNLYRLLYDFYYSLFNDDDLSAITTQSNLPFDSWLCHTLTIITLVGLVFILFLLLRWLFKAISGLILLRN